MRTRRRLKWKRKRLMGSKGGLKLKRRPLRSRPKRMLISKRPKKRPKQRRSKLPQRRLNRTRRRLMMLKQLLM